jgi:ferredoxin--NADP+ reductase
MSAFYREKVLSVRHWTDTLFSFTATAFRLPFSERPVAMIGPGRGLLLRAYSMASANHEENRVLLHRGR